MQSLFTVNNNVSLVSITIAPSAWIASLILSLIFAFVYLVYQSPLSSVRWRKLFSFTRRRQRPQRKAPPTPIIEEPEDDDDETLSEEDPPRRRHIEHTPLPPLLTDYPYPYPFETATSSAITAAAAALLDRSSDSSSRDRDRDSERKEKAVATRSRELRSSDKRSSSASASRSSGKRSSTKDRESGGAGRGSSSTSSGRRHDRVDDHHGARTARPARPGRLRALDWEPEQQQQQQVAVRRPVNALGVPERRPGERDGGRLGLGGFRRWLQSARLEAPRQRRPQQRLLAEG